MELDKGIGKSTFVMDQICQSVTMKLLLTLISATALTMISLSFSSCSKGDDPAPIDEVPTGEKAILMFVSKENTYYSEYIVMKEALVAAGYEIDVRSSATGTASLYMIPAATTISETSNTLPGSSHAQFKTQFKSLFNKDWNESLNTIPTSLTIDGKIQDVTDMDAYSAIVVVGGTGALDYRMDGSYQAQGSVSATDVQSAAEKLNSLALEALQKGKQVMAKCHSASLPVFWKISGGSTSVMAGQYGTGFPEAATADAFSTNAVNYKPVDKVVVANPTESFQDNGNGDGKIVTTRDWYPQTVAHAARTMLNILETYPTKAQQTSQVKVLILHGGAIDASNCGAGNRQNDVPCNYGDGANLPADYSHVKSLLTAVGTDEYAFNVTDLDITAGPLPYTASNQSLIEAYLNGFDVVVFYKHWSTGVNEPLQKAIVAFAENGGGVLGLHHALYNDVDDVDPLLNKNILVNQLFGAQSAESGWSATRDTYKLYSTNHGHFISTFRVPTNAMAIETPAVWTGAPLSAYVNTGLSVFPTFSVFDEVYDNKVFVGGQNFGRGVNEITPLFSNDLGGAQMHTEGFTKMFNPNLDDKIGRVVFLQPGETRANFSTGHPFGQVVRNAVVWLAN